MYLLARDRTIAGARRDRAQLLQGAGHVRYAEERRSRVQRRVRSRPRIDRTECCWSKAAAGSNRPAELERAVHQTDAQARERRWLRQDRRRTLDALSREDRRRQATLGCRWWRTTAGNDPGYCRKSR